MSAPPTKSLSEEPFSYRQIKGDRVQLFYRQRIVETLAGSAAEKFVRRVGGASPREAQLLMARATGNFKRGNERPSKNP